MTTATTNTVVDQTTDAAFRTWVAEVITMLGTTLGVTQTADTGQINTSTVTRASANTAAGYTIWRFNDTAQGTSPIFFKLEFGSAGSSSVPQMWIQMGTGSNGSGTLTGPTTTRVAASDGVSPQSTSTPYTTRGCYNATAGVLWFGWKMNGDGTTNVTLGGFAIFRSADNTGAATTDSAQILTHSNGSGGNFNGNTYLQSISYLTSTAYFTGTPNNAWGFQPFTVNATLFSSNVQVTEVFQYTPVMGVTPWFGIGIVGELAVGSTFTTTLVGSTSHTFISAGGFTGTRNITQQALQTSTGAATTYTIVALWE